MSPKKAKLMRWAQDVVRDPRGVACVIPGLYAIKANKANLAEGDFIIIEARPRRVFV